MIKSNELRIGNIVGVYTGDEWVKYKEIIDHEDLAENSCAEYYPIPLSAEILEKAGFKKDWNGYSLQNIRSVSFAITKDGELLACWLDRSLGFTVNYLHQLQNLYFALTGEELPVEL